MISTMSKLLLIILLSRLMCIGGEFKIKYVHMLIDEGPINPKKYHITTKDMESTWSRLKSGGMATPSKALLDGFMTKIDQKYIGFLSTRYDPTEVEYSPTFTECSKDVLLHLHSFNMARSDIAAKDWKDPNLHIEIVPNANDKCASRDLLIDLVHHHIEVFSSDSFGALLSKLGGFVGRKVTAEDVISVVRDLIAEVKIFPGNTLDMDSIFDAHGDLIVKAFRASLGVLDKEIVHNGMSLGERIRYLSTNQVLSYHLEKLTKVVSCKSDCKTKLNILATNSITIASLLMEFGVKLDNYQANDYLPTIGSSIAIELYNNTDTNQYHFKILHQKIVDGGYEDVTDRIVGCEGSNDPCNYKVLEELYNKTTADKNRYTCQVDDISIYTLPITTPTVIRLNNLRSSSKSCDCQQEYLSKECQDSCSQGFPIWAWILIGIGVTLLIALLCVLIVVLIGRLKQRANMEHFEKWANLVLNAGVGSFKTEFDLTIRFIRPRENEIKQFLECPVLNRDEETPRLDHDAVKMKDSGITYYHANTVTNPINRTVFISAQSPMKTKRTKTMRHTSADTHYAFWTMVVMNNVEFIIDLGDGNELCYPTTLGSVNVAKIQRKKDFEAICEIELISEKLLSDNGTAKQVELKIKWNEAGVATPRKITQRVTVFHVDWIKDGLPDQQDAISLISARISTAGFPVLVHSEYGVGRTGCMIASYYLEKSISTGTIMMKEIVEALRAQRCLSIANVLQYVFVVHQLLSTLIAGPLKDNKKINEKYNSTWLKDYAKLVHSDALGKDEVNPYAH